MNLTPPLHWSESLVLAEMRRERDKPKRVAHMARSLNVPYRTVWMAMIRLQSRGYARHIGDRGPWLIEWGALHIGHRAQFHDLLNAPDDALIPLGEPSVWAKRLDWVLRHFGGTWERAS